MSEKQDTNTAVTSAAAATTDNAPANSGDATADVPKDQTEGGAKENDNEKSSDASKAAGDDEGEEHNDEAENENESPEAAEKHSVKSSLFIKIIGFKRQANIEDELKGYYKFFTESVQVEAPSVQIPGPEDKWVYFEFKSHEDKAKLFKHIRKTYWEGQKLIAKAISIKPNIEVKELKQLSVEEGLNILYPLKDMLYAQQIKNKHSSAKELMDKLVIKSDLQKHTKSKKYLKTIRLREMLPMHPIEGYETTTTVCTETDPSTGDIVYGIRVLSSDRESSVIVPLHQCFSVPHQTIIVAERLVGVLPSVELMPYNPATKEGDLLGFGLRLTTYGSFMLTVIVPNVVTLGFKQLTADGVVIPEGEKTDESYSSLIKKKIDRMRVKIEKLFSEHGSSLCIESVYLLMVHANNLMTSMEDTNSGSFHIVGQKQLPEKLNGINLRLRWEREGQVEVFRPLLSAIERQAAINPGSRLYLASPYRLLGLYFAKICAHVTMYYFWTKEHLSELQAWAKELGYTNIDFVSARTNVKKFPNENAVTIFWQFTKPTLLDRFIQSDIRTIILVSYWPSVVQENHVNLQKKQIESVYTKLKISYICPFDLAPYKDRYGMVFIFNHPLHEIGEAVGRRLKGGVALPGAGRRGRPFQKQVSAFERLGPAHENRSWARPDPWNPRPQMEEMASDVMQNLQTVSQQMQAFVPSLLQQQRKAGGPPKRRYEDFTEDSLPHSSWPNQTEEQYSYNNTRDYKRRRADEPYERRGEDSTAGGRWAGGERSWGGSQPTEKRTYGEQPSSWAAPREQPSSWAAPREQPSSWAASREQPSSWAASREQPPPPYYEKSHVSSNTWNSTPNSSNNWKNDNTDWNNSSWNSANRSYY